MKDINKALVIVIVALLVGDVFALGRVGKDDGPPGEWDARVLPLARYVETARHLRFDHPVDVQFLSVKEYEKVAGGDGGELTDEDKADIAVEEGELRALGLLKKGVSLYDDTNTITTGGTLAFYDPDSETMIIRGTELTVGMKVTIVHELTHALQDQHFNLSRDFNSEAQGELFHALGEGDASRIEDTYADDLTDSEAQAYDAESNTSADEAEAAIADVSPFLTQYFGAPYALGEPLTQIVVKTRGDEGLDDLFRNPPASDETLMDPFALLADAKPTRVGRPKLGAGEKVTHGGDFGALHWYLMLSSFIDEKQALTATDGLAGDAYTAYRKAGRSCVRVNFLGDTPQDNAEMRAALEQWRAAFSPSTVQVGEADGKVTFDSCEPTTATPSPRPSSAESLALPIVRYTLVKEIVESGGSEKYARCGVRELFGRLTFAQLNPHSEAEAGPLNAAIPQAARSCRAKGEI